MEGARSIGFSPANVSSSTPGDPPSRPRLVRWPSQADLRAEAAGHGVPCLLVVEPGAALPVVGPGEDWISHDADERDVASRLAGLVGSGARPTAAADAPLATSVPPGLCDGDARVARVLLARAGRLVPRADLASDATSDATSDAGLDRSVRRVRAALASEGWTINRVSSSGFIAQQASAS